MMGLVFLLITVFSYIYSLNSIKSKTVGDGQHGTARFATKNEIRKTLEKRIPEIKKMSYKGAEYLKELFN